VEAEILGFYFQTGSLAQLRHFSPEIEFTDFINKFKQLKLGKCDVTKNRFRVSKIPVCWINNKANG
jgi:hypothetical protein